MGSSFDPAGNVVDDGVIVCVGFVHSHDLATTAIVSSRQNYFCRLTATIHPIASSSSLSYFCFSVECSVVLLCSARE